jgi:hypothetical protein
MNAKALAVPIATLVAAQALLGWSEAAEHASAGRGWARLRQTVAVEGRRLDGAGPSDRLGYKRR